MCMCEALRRVVICFGWSGAEENRQRGCKEEAGIKDNVETRKARSCVKDWRVPERIEEDEGVRYRSYRGGADAESEERFLASPACAGRLGMTVLVRVRAPPSKARAEKKSESGQVLVEMGDGFYAAEIVFQIEMLVGRVSVFIGQAKANENTGDLERVVHLSDEGDRTAFANEDRFFLETFLESSLGALKNGSVVRSGPGFASTENFEFAVHGFGQKFANVFFDELGDALRILAGDQARGKFRIGP